MTKISAFGDSVLRGVVIDRETSDDSRIKYTFLQNNFTNICADRLGMEIMNYGKFGSTVDTGEKMLGRHIASVRNSDCTLLEFGGNDCDYNYSKYFLHILADLQTYTCNLFLSYHTTD